MIELAKSIGKSFLDLVYPPICLNCHEMLGDSTAKLCPSCMQLLIVIDPATRCPYCFSPKFNPHTDSSCVDCRKQACVIDRIGAVFDYEGPAATLVKRMKYGGQFYLSKGIGAYMTAQFLALDWPIPDLIVPMPMSRLRKFERGYNQSELIAGVMGGLLNCQVVSVLKRSSGDFSQAGLNHEQRVQLKSDAFSLINETDLYDKTVLLVDDVMTTGSSLRCCAEVLRRAYPEKIYALTFCRAI